MYFANAVLQLLVRSPPFWNLFRELGDLKGQRGAGDPETGGRTTPLGDVTVSFFKEFVFEGSSISRLFGGRSRLTVRAPNRPDAITVEDWRVLRLNI
jgi:hypothetical protein